MGSKTLSICDTSATFAASDLQQPYKWFTKRFAVSGHTRLHLLMHHIVNLLHRSWHLKFLKSTSNLVRVRMGGPYIPFMLYCSFPPVIRTTHVRQHFSCIQRPDPSLCSTLPFSGFVLCTPSWRHHKYTWDSLARNFMFLWPVSVLSLVPGKKKQPPVCCYIYSKYRVFVNIFQPSNLSELGILCSYPFSNPNRVLFFFICFHE